MTKIKRFNQINTFLFEKEGEKHIVTIKYLKNTPSGAPRFEAVVIPNVLGDKYEGKFNAVFTFQGSYQSIKQEAEDILLHYLEVRKSEA